MGFSLTHCVILLVIVLVIFGAGRVPSVMKDVAKGIKAFRDGLKDDTL
jgi:sec-independent protein translocase protein TatA